MKFGKTLAKRQLDIPDYAASFVNYKALKKLIKSLGVGRNASSDPQAALQANKATFFFRLERELEKVNAFYLQKEDELKLRLKALSDKKSIIQSRGGAASKISSNYITLREGFQQFERDLRKLQQFVEINATAFSKILKKWDKSSKSRTKELYISRAVEVQPCFNREVICELSDKATTNLLQLEAWAEGEKITYVEAGSSRSGAASNMDESDADAILMEAIQTNNVEAIGDWITRLQSTEPDAAAERVTRIFLATISDAPQDALNALTSSNLINFDADDEINERNCLHEAAIAGKMAILGLGMSKGVDAARQDVYGRIPLHYAAIHGHLEMLRILISASPVTIDFGDHDNFTALIHSIINNRPECVRLLIHSGARVDPRNERDYIPLNLACQHGLEEISEVLLRNKAQILPDAEGLFPQHLVARSGRSSNLLRLLQQYGADVNEADKLFQWTPLLHAASEGHLECLKTLLSLGARVDKADENGLSALYYAAWEGHLDCMRLLFSAGSGIGVTPIAQRVASPFSVAADNGSSGPMALDSDDIPDLSLPPPILPLRRYGHNFLENKTLVQLSFEQRGAEAIQFDDESKYPAARLTISSKSSDLIARNLILPLTEDNKSLSFQIDTLESFAIDFDVYPTFGSRIVARTIALSDTFRDRLSGHCILPLIDSRLRAIGRLSFDFRIIKPYDGIPLEIAHFATYWKATSQVHTDSTTLVTGSSLAGEYLRLQIQLSANGVPVLYSDSTVSVGGVDLPVACLSQPQYDIIQPGYSERIWEKLRQAATLAELNHLLTNSFVPLRDVLTQLSPSVHVELNVIRPTTLCDDGGAMYNVNPYVNTVLKIVFDHMRNLKQNTSSPTRSIMFSSSDKNICTALNWKQPNFPVFFSNDSSRIAPSRPATCKQANATTDCSMKDAVRFANGNNLMGLIGSSDLLDTVPALVQQVKSSGLVLVSRIGLDSVASLNVAGVDGVLGSDGVLKFEKTIDM